MILYGRLHSPYARRIMIQAALQQHGIERRDLLTRGPEFEKLRALNPVGRIPVLVLDDGTHMTETWTICDWLDETAPNGQRMVPGSGTARREVLQRLAIAGGVTDKSVSLVYERNRRPEEFHWMEWQQRIVAQVQGGLAALEQVVPSEGLFGGGVPDISDIATVIAWELTETRNPWVLQPGYPKLQAFAKRTGALPEFARTRPEG